MKKNIVLVGFCEGFIKDIIPILSKKLKMDYIDADNLIDDNLLKTAHYPLLLVDAALSKIESRELAKTNLQENMIIKISPDMFVSNKNYKNLSNCHKILIKASNINEIDKKIENLIEKQCDFKIDNDKMPIDFILDKLRGINE